MPNPAPGLFTAMSLLFMASVAKGACGPQDLKAGWLWNYEGSIAEKYRIRVTLTATGDGVEGVYFYATQLEDIHLSGRVVEGHMTLDELDAAGKVTARFEGQFADRDPHGRFQGALRCEVIVGSWRKPGEGKELPLYLSQESGTWGSLGHRYEVAGAKDDETVHRGALRFWNAVARGDKETAAASIRYPIKVRVGAAVRSIRSRQELISNYDAIFPSAYRQAIAAALPRNMFARDQGIMLGNGQVWFGPDGRVIALNND
jgi:hypothetical protein